MSSLLRKANLSQTQHNSCPTKQTRLGHPSLPDQPGNNGASSLSRLPVDPAMKSRQDQQKMVRILDLDSVKVISPVGRGAKGVVFLVKEELSGELWALKVISRDFVERKRREINDWNEYKRISFEQQALSIFKHPLLPRLRAVLSTDKILGYAIDYCPGGDLHYLRKQQSEKMFSADVIRFYAAELVIALEYLHNLGIAYRDLKPENVMIQDNGHIMLVDFDLSTRLPPKSGQSSPISKSDPKPPQSVSKKRFFSFRLRSHSGISPERILNSASSEADDMPEKSNSFVGTEEYVAPEVIQGYGHDFAVDWWSLGVVLYEMLYGMTPFKGVNRKETFCRILTKSPELVGEATPLRDLIGKLLIKDPRHRIGLEEIKAHHFFSGVNWDLILHISRPPNVPAIVNGNNNEGIEGIKKVDMELFVQGIFASGEDKRGVEHQTKKIDSDGNSHNTREESKNNKGMWVKGLHNHPRGIENFPVF